jgi:hypothetical protein
VAVARSTVPPPPRQAWPGPAPDQSETSGATAALAALRKAAARASTASRREVSRADSR